MIEFIESGALVAFFAEWTVRAVVESSVWILLLLIIERLGFLSARWIAILWFCAVARLWLPPVGIGVMPAGGVLLPLYAAPLNEAIPTASSGFVPRHFGLWLLAGWAAVAGLRCFGLVQESRRVRRYLRDRTVRAERGIVRDLPALARQLGLRKTPAIRRAEDGPPAWSTGILRPVVVLRSGLEASEQEVALRHELEHHRRRDSWAQLALEFTRRVWWFHPLLGLAARRAHVARELACDAGVLDRWPTGQREYSLCLARSAALELGFELPGLAGQVHGWSRPASIVERLRALEQRAGRDLTGRTGWVCQLACVGAIGLGSALGVTRFETSVSIPPPGELPAWWSQPDDAFAEVERWRERRPGMGCSTGRLVYLRALALQP